VTPEVRDACAGKGAGEGAGKGAGRPPPARRRLPPLRGGALRCSQCRPRRETRYARFASSARTVAASQKYEARCARGPALLRFSAAHRRAGGRRPAPLPAALRRSRRPSPASMRAPRASPSRQAAAGRAAAARGATGRRAAACGGAGPGEALSAAPSSAALGSAREARFVHLTRGDCPSGAREASAASFAARPRGEQRREVGARHRPPRPAPRPALPRRTPRPGARWRPARPRPGPLPPAATRRPRCDERSCVLHGSHRP